MSLECDCADPASIARTFATVAERYIAIDVLVYNAGYAQPAQDGNPMGGQLAHEIPIANFDMAYKVHVSGLLLCAQQCLPAMLARSSGAILVTGNTM